MAKTKAVNPMDDFEEVFKSLEKDFGVNAGRPITQHELQAVPRISTGLRSLDYVLGGGLPLGRILELFGPESSGKTSICLKIIAEAQKQGHVCAMVDAEHAFDPVWAAKLGVNLDTLLFHQAMTGEESLEVTKALVETGKVRVIVIDSVAALTPQAEAAGDIGATHMGRLARLMAQSLRILVPLAAKNHCTLVFTNQVRMMIGVVYGNPETTPGGLALRFASSVRLKVSRKKHEDGSERIGDKVTITAIKNKVGRPFLEAHVPLVWGLGFDLDAELFDLIRPLLTASGSWYSYEGERMGQGEIRAATWLKEHPEVAKELLEKTGIQSP